MFVLEPYPPDSRGRNLGVGLALALVAISASLAVFSQLTPTVVKLAPKRIVLRMVTPEPIVKLPVPPPATLPASPPEGAVAPKPASKSSPRRSKPIELKPPKHAKAKPTEGAQPESLPMSSPPLVVGLTLSSVGRSGRGPRFSLGNTQMGRPGAVASDAVGKRKSQPAGLPSVKAPSNRSVSKVRTAATLRKGAPPKYPEAAKGRGIEGVVVLSITIGREGRVLAAQVLRGLGGQFDQAALTAAKNTLWIPATLGGQPTQTTRRFNVRFSLQG